MSCKQTSADEATTIEETSPQGPFTLQQEVVATNIPIPWGMAFVDKDNLLVTEKSGKVFLVNIPLKTSSDIFTVPGARVFGQGGLLDIALHPQFSQNQWVYFTYAKSQGTGFTTALGRAKYSSGSISGFEEIFVANAVTNGGVHFGSRIVFDRQGFLYMSIGDRGQMQQAQNTRNHIGCVLRLKDDGTTPADNPFFGKTDTLPEIWTFGNRNIQGMAMHPVTGEIWTHEHGPQGGDEINIMRKGVNHGWPLVTFGVQYGGTVISTDTARAGIMPPIHHWTPSIAPSGMVFLTGNRYPGWQNNLFSGSLVLQHLNMMKIENEKIVTETRYFANQGRIRNVALSPDGYLYMANETSGTIIKLIPIFE
jgi:glucose/arabinose dehydrogenase